MGLTMRSILRNISVRCGLSQIISKLSLKTHMDRNISLYYKTYDRDLQSYWFSEANTKINRIETTLWNHIPSSFLNTNRHHIQAHIWPPHSGQRSYDRTVF